MLTYKGLLVAYWTAFATNLVLTLLVQFIVPSFVEMFMATGLSLPAMTLFAIRQPYLWLILPILWLIFAVRYTLAKQPARSVHQQAKRCFLILCAITVLALLVLVFGLYAPMLGLREH